MLVLLNLSLKVNGHIVFCNLFGDHRAIPISLSSNLTVTELSQLETLFTVLIKCDFFGQQTKTRWNRIRQAIPPRKGNAANFFDGSKRSPIFLLAFDVSIISVDSNGARSGPPPPLSSLKFICQRFTAPSFSPDDSDFSAATWRGSRLSSPAQWARRTDD